MSDLQLASAGYTVYFNLNPAAKKRQMIRHASMHGEIVAAAEQSRERDFYSAAALFRSKASRSKSNVKSLQVCWVDLDCYKNGIVPTDDFVERLVDRAVFAGIPRPTHIVHSGRGLYIKWLLDAPVPDSHLEMWELVQLRLNQLYEDVGADIAARDSARVLRVVNTVNSKVGGQDGSDRSGLVRVTWEGGQRYSFESLLRAASLLDNQIATDIKKAGAKVAHQVGAGIALVDFTLPESARGSIVLLRDYGVMRQPSFDLEQMSKAEGKRGLSARTLAWYRWLDIRDLLQSRVESGGGTGIPEGCRDLTLMWMVNFLAQAGVVNSRNVHQEIDSLLRAFDGVGYPGPHGFEHPMKSGALNTLLHRIKASEAGQRYQYGGGLWDPKYTPSNDYLINLFRVTNEEMRGLRTLIDQDEKLARSDRKVEGRAERRDARKSWNAEALRMRDEQAAARQAGDKDAVPEQKVCATIAQALGLVPRTVREFLRRHDGAAALKEARKAGKAPPRAYRKPADLSPEQLEERNRLNAKRKHARLVAGIRKNGYEGDGSPEDVQAWFDSKKAAFQAEMARNAAAAAEESRAKQEEGVRNMNAQLERLMRHVREGAGVPDVLDQIADGTIQESPAPSPLQVAPARPVPSDRGLDGDDNNDLPVSPEVESMTKTIFREIGRLRENPPIKDSPSIMNPLPVSPSSPVEPTAVASAAKKTSKRALLDKARKAQSKDALPASANDPVIDGSASPPVEAGPAGPATIATSVIPPDLLESWGGGSADDPERAGMPDLDDGYLDSFADGDAPVVGHPPASPAPVTAPAVASSKTPPVLAFARGTKPGSPAAAPARGFGFNRAATPPAPGAPARPAAAPAGFSVRKPAVLPSKPLGFGAPARLSTDQAKVNGQSHDFAKLFDEPQYGDDGMPTTYPAPKVWPSNDLPAGSRYTPEEWANAREPDAELPTGHVVVEVQVGNPVRSALLRVPRKAAPESSAKPVARTVVIDGKVVKQEPYRGIDDPMADAIADTIVVSRKSPIAEEVRGAVEGGIEIAHGGVSSYFRIIRPRSHYSDPEKFIYINSKLHMSGSLGEAGARMAPSAPEALSDAIVEQAQHEHEEQPEQEELEAAEAPRG
ncbi:hypothetical protein [Variovorax ginsengisoli]|uniref:Uncharacterized protein n=1 Tax=Variovorax ginsengisoli TaxID=363844 RepID=A0ABT8S9X0_9BURK|nr:hypothetical protein [Variovorax ginsengisoli]MDN8616413.1 hypothetical protein [Variovorax ginsengisoli]MDO1535583.1 hypothetical protein [Variovorax ginsengisoli]